MKNHQRRGEGRYLLEAAAGATAGSSLEAQWSMERLGGSKGFISGRVQPVITLSYAHLVWWGERTVVVVEAEAKGEIGNWRKY